jgi:putative transposase
VGKRQLQRLRRAQGLRVPPTKRKIVRRGLSTGLPTKAIHRGHVWTWDFISDATVRGGTLRILTILDEHTRECHVLRADRALRSKDVLEWLGKAIKEPGAPQYLRSDNGSEFIAKEVQRWLAQNQIKTIYIEPASPWQNGFVESFHGRFRDECLNRGQLWTLTEALSLSKTSDIATTTFGRTASWATKAQCAMRSCSLHRQLRSGSALPTAAMDKPKPIT